MTENPALNFIAKVGVNVLATNVGNEIIRSYGKKWGFIDEEMEEGTFSISISLLEGMLSFFGGKDGKKMRKAKGSL